MTTTRNIGETFESASIAPGALKEIEQHAREAYPDECCGALIAREGRIVRAFRLPNTTAAGARRRFRIGPSDYRQAEQQARDSNGTLAGFYHSHPDSPARPSQHDLEHAWPNLIYTITTVVRGEPGETTAWRLRDDRSGFDRQDI
jgi:proteasome lid subunit RPN8/RPN11